MKAIIIIMIVGMVLISGCDELRELKDEFSGRCLGDLE